MGNIRIIGGQYGGRQLETPAGNTTRPTANRLRESVFNILHHVTELTHAHVLDVFAGTGAFGLEALSRGAAFAAFIEFDRHAVRTLTGNVQSLGVQSKTQIHKINAVKPGPCTDAPADLVFLDPPYDKNLLPQVLIALLSGNWCTQDALLVCEQAAIEPSIAVSGFQLDDERTFGRSRFSFLSIRS